MSEEVLDCVFNRWTGFTGKATCDAGFLKCDEMSCPAYTPRQGKKPQTNADRIRSMTDEELAGFINDTDFGFIDRPGMCDVCDHHRIKDCLCCWLSWLKSPVEVDDGCID